MARILLSDQGLIGLLDVAEGAETVELKLAEPDSDIASTRPALAFDLLDTQIRERRYRAMTPASSRTRG